MLISKAIVDGVEGGAGKYSAQQRQRLYREGIREFFRLDTGDGPRIDTIGDCGAFQYVREDVPPYSVDEVIDFYEGCGVDAGISLDHVILGFELHPPLERGPAAARMAAASASSRSTSPREFLAATASASCTFEPVGVAQGWSPDSYAAVGRSTSGHRLRADRHRRAGRAEDPRDPRCARGDRRGPRRRDVELHLLGVTRTEQVAVVPALRRHELRQHLAVSSGVQGRPRQLLRRSTAPGSRCGSRRSTPTRSCSGGSAPARSTAAPHDDSSSSALARRCAPTTAATAIARDGRRCAARVRGAPRRAPRPQRPVPRDARRRAVAVVRLRGLQRRSGSRSRSSAAPSATSAAASTTCTCSRSASNDNSRRRAPQPRSESHDQPHRCQDRDATNCASRRSRSEQNRRRTLYSFAVDGKKLPLVRRRLAGQARRRASSRRLPASRVDRAHPHDPPLPRDRRRGAPERLVVAFDSRVRFEPIGNAIDGRRRQIGHLIVPVDEAETDDEKPAGSSTASSERAAIREADVEQLPGLRHCVHHRQRDRSNARSSSSSTRLSRCRRA